MALARVDIDALRDIEAKRRFRTRIGPPPWPETPVRNPKPAEVIAWLRDHLPASKFRVLAWYREVIGVLYGERPTQTVVSIARGNGKTTLAAALGVYELLGRGLDGPQILLLATSSDQAKNLFDEAVKLIYSNPQLTSWSEPRWHAGRHRRVVPQLGGYMAYLATKEGSLQGYTATLAVVDEMGFVSPRVWSAMVQGATKRDEARVLGIGTPGYDQHGTMYQLRTVARERRPAGLRYMEWAAPQDCELTDQQAWEIANPGIKSRVKSKRKMAEVVGTTPEQEFRQMQLGQWVGANSRWLPWRHWQALARRPAPGPGEPIVLGFDGSESGDSTAICWATLDAIGVVQVWERVEDPEWRVPRGQVVERILAACQEWEVRAICADPSGWRSELDVIERDVGDRLHRVGSNDYAKFAPWCDRLYQAVAAHQIAWDGDETLSRHIHNAVPVPTRAGTAVDKAYRGAREKIDAAVACIYAFEWAARTMQPAPPEPDLAGAIW